MRSAFLAALALSALTGCALTPVQQRWAGIAASVIVTGQTATAETGQMSSKYIVTHYHSLRYWIDGQGWSTTDSDRATRYTRDEAVRLASQMHGEAVAA
jgi:hypothetical protein